MRVGSHLGANPAFVPELVDRALERYRTGQPGPGDILERIPWFHGEFETIHPFVDGNGRIGRGVPRSARNLRRARESQGVDSVHVTRLVMLAPTARLRARLPRELDPLEVVPGLGVFSVMFFRYDVADIDFYTEVATGIAVKPVRHGGLGAVDLVAALKNDHLHSYVLSLPVSTDIAQVRGHDGYGFPKWVAPIEVDVTAERATARARNDNGGLDLAFTAPTPPQRAFRPLERVSTLTSYARIGGNWHSTLNQTHVLAAGSRMLPRDVELRLGSGRLSDDIRSVAPRRILRLDVTSKAQIALHMPVPTSVDTTV